MSSHSAAMGLSLPTGVQDQSFAAQADPYTGLGGMQASLALQ